MKPTTIPTPVGQVQIIYDFVSVAEEKYLISKIDVVGGTNTNKAGGWKDLNGRRSMYWGGTVISSQTLIPAPFPTFMDTAWPNVLTRIQDTEAYGPAALPNSKGPNHCLVNEYLPGQGIMPHTDGPAYQPLVSTLSLGSHTILSLRPSLSSASSPPITSNSKSTSPSSLSLSFPLPSPSSSNLPSKSPQINLFLPPRSLLLLSGELYINWLHGIEQTKVDKMSDLMRCVNWEGWWSTAGGGKGEGYDSAGVDYTDELEGVEEEGEEVKLEVVSEEEEALTQSEDVPCISIEAPPPSLEFEDMIKEIKLTEKEQAVKDLVDRRRMVERGEGWERTRRISLTCRRVEKVRKGILRFG